MTLEQLKSSSLKDLAALARRRGVAGWQSMGKEQLVRALLPATARNAKSASRRAVGRVSTAAAKKPAPAAKPASPRRTPTAAAQAKTSRPANQKQAKTTKPVAKARTPAPQRAKPAPVVERLPPKPLTPHAQQQLQAFKVRNERLKNLSLKSESLKHKPQRDRLVVMVRDPYWLHAYWELTRHSVERAQAALGQYWHAARPVLRLMQISSSGGATDAEMQLRDIDIHGGCNNWYIEVQDPPHSYRVEIGYLTPQGRFYSLARSNVVTTPKAGVSDALDENWTEVAENIDKIFAQSVGYTNEGSSTELQELFEERLRRPMGSPMVTKYGAGVDGLLPRKREFAFELDAELIVFGTTEPTAHVTLQGEPIKVRPDGSFTVRYSLPNCRQVIPAVACSADGLEQRTVVLAVERNTKVMEPLVRENNE